MDTKNKNGLKALAAILWAWSGSALAVTGNVPHTLTFSGYLADGTNAPISGAGQQLIFELTIGGVVQWCAQYNNVTANNGMVSVVLGSNAQGGAALMVGSPHCTPNSFGGLLQIPTAVLSPVNSASAVALNIQIFESGTWQAFTSSFPISSSLFAFQAESLGGAFTVNSSSQLVSGATPVIDSSGNWIGGNITTGSIPAANITGTLPATVNGSNITGLTASQLAGGGTLPAENASNLTNIPAANIVGTLPAVSGASLTNLNAAQISSGTLAIANGGTAATSAAAALTNLGAAAKGANSDITSTTALTTITSTTALGLLAGGANQNINLTPTGAGTVDVASKRVTNVATPTTAADAANKAYVDAAGGGSCPVIGGSTYYTTGGSPSFCQQASLSASGTYVYQSINNGMQCGTGMVCSSGACIAGTPQCTTGVIGANCGGGALYVGYWNGYNYMTTPGGCNNSATPTCLGGMDTTAIFFAFDDNTGATPAYNVYAGATDFQYGYPQSVTLATNYTDTKAAKFCRGMTYGGYSDWYLPAYNELYYVLYNNQVAIGGFSTGFPNYVSSTQASSTTNYVLNFTTAGFSTPNSSTGGTVRCVRRF